MITGATDGIGLETARLLASLGHHVLLHGRSTQKLGGAEAQLSALSGGGRVESFVADFSILEEVEALAEAVAAKHTQLDVLINNAGVFTVNDPATKDGLDVRFVVNAIAPYLLTRQLLPLLPRSSRVVNLSSAAQSPVDPSALAGGVALSDGAAYAQSKLALTMWSRALAHSFEEHGPIVVAVNPGSMLGTKMVKEAYGVEGANVQVGAEILRRAALDDEFAAASGKYFDNDTGQFASPHPDALDVRKCSDVMLAIEAVLAKRGINLQ